jgi:hypothetical protein
VDRVGDLDDLIRIVLPPSSNSDSTAKYYARNTDGSWNRIDLNMANSLLKARFGGNIDILKESMREHPWRRVFMPFYPEYPGNRSWNLDPITYAVEPEEGEFPTWARLYDHWGDGLTTDLADDLWAREHGIVTGRQYLEMWVACVLQQPQYKLPYLFLTGPQNGGKSFFHETLHYLIGEGGVVDASNALRDKHNSEIAKAVVCVADDVDFKKEKGAVYEKIKRWVTGLRMNVDQKYLSIYEVDNYTHWIQCNNDVKACPVFTGDTRITVIYINQVPTDKRLPKEQLDAVLRDEAPHFLNYLLNLPIPPCNDRLRIPVITTATKDEAVSVNENVVNLYMNEFTVDCPGAKILLSKIQNELEDRYGVTLDTRQLGRQMSSDFMRGQDPITSSTYVLNRRTVDEAEPEDRTPYIIRGRYFRKRGDEE